MGLGGLLEARRVHRKVALERSLKPTKYELQGPHGDPVYELPGTRTGWNNHLVTSGRQVALECSSKPNEHEDGDSVYQRPGTLSGRNNH